MGVPREYVVQSEVINILDALNSRDSTVQNSGNSNINISEYPNMTQSFTLTVGSTIQWDAGRALYAYSITGTGKLHIMDGGGQLTDAAAIAKQIILQGLADDIAAKLLISGVPPVDPRSQLLFTAFSTATMPGSTDDIDTTKYGSLIFDVRDHTNDAASATVVQRVYTVIWLDSTGSYEVARDVFRLGDDNNNAFGPLVAYGRYQTPVVSPRCRLTVNANGRADSTVNVTVYGSYRSTREATLFQRSAWNGADPGYAAILSNINKAGGTAYAQTLHQVAQRYKLTCVVNAAVTVAGTVGVFDEISTAQPYCWGGFYIPATANVGDVYTTECVIPNRPVRLGITAPMACASLVVSLAPLYPSTER